MVIDLHGTLPHHEDGGQFYWTSGDLKFSPTYGDG